MRQAMRRRSKRFPAKGEQGILPRALLLFHSLRHSKPRQLFLRLWGLIKTRTGLPHTPASPYNLRRALLPKNAFLHHDCWNRREEVKQGRFCFLNRVEPLGCPINWQAANPPKLWQYNLHYFDYLYLLTPEEQRQICLQWVGANPLSKGLGWHAYPTSLRIVNWCKAQMEDADVLRSLYQQAAYLYRHMEAHHPGNHLLENAKALIFAGSFFAGQGEAQSWFDKGMEIYRRETPVQVLADGAYFERSPMYHALMLAGYLDILNILPAADKEPELVDAAKRLSDFLFSVTGPEGDIALFNDATREIAPKSSELLDYAQKLLGYGAEKKALFAEAGYFIHESAAVYLIIDGGAISPAHLPSHAHADIFSYELSLYSKLFVVDAGVFEYEAGEMREYVRSTRAHNTVCVDRKDQAECWGSFRVGRRYPPFDVRFVKTGPLSRFQGSFDGYAKLIGDRIRHHRSIVCDEERRELVIEDVLEGLGEHLLESCVHLHPDVELTSEGSRVFLRRDAVTCVIDAEGQDLRIEDSWYCPEFGLKQKNKMLVIGGRLALPTRLSYRIDFSQ
jgi:uncharacterized heparinase superfamily protein